MGALITDVHRGPRGDGGIVRSNIGSRYNKHQLFIKPLDVIARYSISVAKTGSTMLLRLFEMLTQFALWTNYALRISLAFRDSATWAASLNFQRPHCKAQRPIADNVGNSVLAEFGSAVDAVECAVRAPAALAESNAEIEPERHINFRIGLHVGNVMVRAGDLFGKGVNIAARLEELAEPGGICISSSAYEQVRGKVALEFDDLGEQSLKNFNRPVQSCLAAPSIPLFYRHFVTMAAFASVSTNAETWVRMRR
jgi:class 3 adenylate cyclase